MFSYEKYQFRVINIGLETSKNCFQFFLNISVKNKNCQIRAIEVNVSRELLGSCEIL